MTEENKCAICWEDIGEKNTSVMSCGHTFHFSCITSNILKGSGDHSMNCPLCRELIVDKEFEDCSVEIVQDDDTDSIATVEAVPFNRENYWTGLQLWRRDLYVRDKVMITVEMDTVGEMLNRMGWDIKDNEIVNHYPDPNSGVINCEVVCVIDHPIQGMAPFLLKPIDGRNRLQIQAYQPKQEEVLNIELLNIDLFDDEPQGDRLGTWAEQEAEQMREENQWHLQALRNEIMNEQIYDKETPDLINLIEHCFDDLGCRKDLYTQRTVKSIVHKVTVDVVKAFKDEKRRKAESVETRIDELGAPQVSRTVSI